MQQDFPRCAWRWLMAGPSSSLVESFACISGDTGLAWVAKIAWMWWKEFLFGIVM